MKRILWLAVILSVVTASFVCIRIYSMRRDPPSIAGDADADATADTDSTGETWKPWQISGFALTDSEEFEVNSDDLRGDVWVATLFAGAAGEDFQLQIEAMKRLYDRFNPQGVRFVSIASDPEKDTPEVLRRYARQFDADPEEWFFLTGNREATEQIGKDLRLPADSEPVSSDFVVIDRWGWVRSSFDWQQAEQISDLEQKLSELLRETGNPHSESVPEELPDGWLREFSLTERSGREFQSQELRGRVWVASFFFSTCPSVCRTQNELVASLHKRFGHRGIVFVCITCDPETDTPKKLADYARLFDAHPEQWLFLTGDLQMIRRIAAEKFDVPIDRCTHVERFLVVDQAGQLRGSFDWHDRQEMRKLERFLDELLEETVTSSEKD